ncbi:hypothetical protein ACWEVP_20375 [Amycolatopsis sp. NPDC003865]
MSGRAAGAGAALGNAVSPLLVTVPVRDAIPLGVGVSGKLKVVFEALSHAGTLTISELALLCREAG